MIRATLLLGLGALGAYAIGGAAAAQTPPMPPPATDGADIAATVNGQVITNQDVIDRSELLAASTGLPPTPTVMQHLQPQITQQLIDQTLKLQEINRRNVVVQEADIGAAIDHIEQNNNMQPGGLRQRLEAGGIPFSTLIAQVRTDLGWQSVLKQVLGPGLTPTPGDVAAQKQALKAEIGSTQYHLSEIFIPVTDPANETTARGFADTVIGQLRQGAPFTIVAAQFSQSPTALSGGDLGYVPLSQLDPAVADVVKTMPPGAVSNPIRVPGGYDIVQLQGTHAVGNDPQTILSVRQAFVAYPEPITNGQVGPDQAAVIEKLVAQGKNAKSCADIQALNQQDGGARASDPGAINLATVTPPRFQALLASLPVGQVSQPLVEQDGVSILMVCSRQSSMPGLPSDDDIRQMIVERRVDLESQQLLEDLRHRSIIDQGADAAGG